MRLIQKVFAAMAVVFIFAHPVSAEEDKAVGEQFQFQADVNKLMVCTFSVASRNVKAVCSSVMPSHPLLAEVCPPALLP